jgi:hypothetical protein
MSRRGPAVVKRKPESPEASVNSALVQLGDNLVSYIKLYSALWMGRLEEEGMIFLVGSNVRFYIQVIYAASVFCNKFCI